MKNVITLMSLVGLIAAVVALGGMALTIPDNPNVCVIGYNSALADVVHMKKEMQILKELMWRMQEKPLNIPGRRVLWDI